MKTMWITSVETSEQLVGALMHKFKTYGLAAAGHQWINDVKAMAWLGAKERLVDANCAFWVIVGGRQALMNPELRYGLAMLALSVKAQRGRGFPVVVLQTDASLLTDEQLPTPLQPALILSATDAGTPAKLVAKLHARPAELPAAYHVDMVGSTQVGQWFEVHPTDGTWPGIIFGVDQGEIKFQAVGPAGALPQKCTLNYPMRGLTLDYQQKVYTAWAVRNEISVDTAYYVKVEGCPTSILFGPFSEQAATEMYLLTLC